VNLRRLATGEMLLAMALMAGAVAVDALWFRPQEREHRRLVAARQEAEEALSRGRRLRIQSEEVLRYASGEDEPASGRKVYTEEDPLLILEEIRRESGLAREDLAFRQREPVGSLVRANYIMSVTGPFSKQLRFLHGLERAVPLVTVQKLTLADRPDEPGLTLRLDVSVLTVPEEAGS
jgi:hypothetical protein